MAKAPLKAPRSNDLEGEIRDARARALRRRREEAYVTDAMYDRDLDRVAVRLSNGFHFSFPPTLFSTLAEGNPDQLSTIEIDPSGYGLRWPQLDADYDVAGVVQTALGAKRWLSVSELGRLGGRSTSPAKRAAAIANGRKGGRPRKTRGRHTP